MEKKSRDNNNYDHKVGDRIVRGWWLKTKHKYDWGEIGSEQLIAEKSSFYLNWKLWIEKRKRISRIKEIFCLKKCEKRDNKEMGWKIRERGEYDDKIIKIF